MAQGKAGRPTETYTTSTGEKIIGLSKQADGRWRINSLNIRWTEPNEYKAIAKAKKLLGIADLKTVAIEGDYRPEAKAVVPQANYNGHPVDQTQAAIAHYLADQEQVDGIELTTDYRIPEAILFPWIARQLATNVDEIGTKVGIHDLRRRLYDADLDVPSIILAEIITNYKNHGTALPKAKQEACKPLERLMAHAGAKTLDDLTTAALLAWKQQIEKTVPGPATRRAYYARVKSVIAFGLKTGMDAAQIRPCLDRCKVLWTAAPMPSVNPQPIEPKHFHTLLATGNGTWQAWLLLGLNLCLHIEEVCALKWESFDLDKATYATIRNKTRRQRIPRAATLWPETVEAIRAIRRTENPYVFISTHGTRYNKNTRVNDFKDLRTKAQLPDAVTFDTIRDGAYTAACNGAEERLARILAGHRSAGLQDNYVLRNPEITRPACNAVYTVYGPFPK